MTVLEFLLLPKKEIKVAFIKAGCTTHHYFDNVRKNELDEFCNLFNLEKGECESLGIYKNGSYCKLIFYMSYPFIVNDEAWRTSHNGNIRLYLSGTSKSSFDINNPLIDDEDIYIYHVETPFFRDKETYNNVEVSIPIKYHDTLEKQLEYIKDTTNELMPHIEFVMNSTKDGSFIEAYNNINDEPFVVGKQGWEGAKFELYSKCHLLAKKKFNYDMSILDCMILYKYQEDNKQMYQEYANTHPAEEYDFEEVLFEYIKTFENFQKILKEYNEKYKVGNQTLKNKEIFENAKNEFQKEMKNLVNQLSQKYKIHESYFFINGHINEPKSYNIDLSKPSKNNIKFFK